MKRQYQNDYPSVTEVLSVLRKPALENWFKYNTPQKIKEESEKALEIGDQIHKLIQDHIERDTMKVATKYPEEVRNAVKSFMLFKKEHPEIKLKRSEIALTSENYKFNGTVDCLAEINGEKILLDWKTGKLKDKDKPPIYDEYLYQASAYVELLNESSEQKISRAFIVAIAKDGIGYAIKEIETLYIVSCFSMIFLPCLKILAFKKQKEEVKNGL